MGEEEFVNHSQEVIEALDTALEADARFLDITGEIDNQENGSVGEFVNHIPGEVDNQENKSACGYHGNLITSDISILDEERTSDIHILDKECTSDIRDEEHGKSAFGYHGNLLT